MGRGPTVRQHDALRASWTGRGENMATASSEEQSRELPIETARLSSRRGLLEESRRAVVGLVLVVGDWLTLATCLSGVWLVRARILPLFAEGLPNPYALSYYFSSLYFFAPWLIALAAVRLYSRHAHFWDEVHAVVRGSTFGTVLAVLINYLERADEDVSRSIIVGLWLVSLPALSLVRHRLKTVLAALGLWSRRVLIVGCGEAARDVANALREDPALGYQPVGFVANGGVDPAARPGDGPGIRSTDLAVLGRHEDIPDLLRDMQVRDVVIAMPEASREELVHVVALCEGRVDSLRVMPDMVGMAVTDVETEALGGNLLISMRSNLARPTNLVVKRGTDLVGALLLLIPAAPLLLIIAALIRLDTRGPAFYVQQRVGRHGRLFPCFKFRTMHLDADTRLEAHLATDPAAREEWDHYMKLRGFDPRVTRVGRTLRRLSLDELPQLVNVLRGEMSLVGPRPYIEHEMAGHEDAFRTILLSWPGITGLWQVSGRNELNFVQRLRLDEYYVRNWALLLDVQILLRTFGVLARTKGAY
jgi:Undecaprenyl-phosphate galactose phosphotransferase WbaP